MKSRPLRERFADKVDSECSEIFWNGTRCKEWAGTTTKGGYGQIHSGGITVYAHRVAWELENGPPGSLYVLHRCDNRKCVSTDHLFLGTFDDNMADMMAKNRQASGERSGHAKLTNDQVIAIRASNEKQAVLAVRYGIGQAYVSILRAGKRRKSIEKI